jgi:hypothetical protein
MPLTDDLLRALFNHTLNNPFGKGRVESRLRYPLSLSRRGNARIEILLNDADELQILGVMSRHRFSHLSHAAAVTTEVGVSGRDHQRRRGAEQDGDSGADRGGGGETHVT